MIHFQPNYLFLRPSCGKFQSSKQKAILSGSSYKAQKLYAPRQKSTSAGFYRSISWQNGTGGLNSKIHAQAQNLLAALEAGLPHATTLKFEQNELTNEMVNAGRRIKFKTYAIAASDKRIQPLLEEYVLPLYIEAASKSGETFKVTNQMNGGYDSEINLPDIESYSSLSEAKKLLVRAGLLLRELRGYASTDDIEEAKERLSPIDSLIVSRFNTRNEDEQYLRWLELMRDLHQKGFSQIANSLGTIASFRDDLISNEVLKIANAFQKESLFDHDLVFGIGNLRLEDVFDLAQLFKDEMELNGISEVDLRNPSILLTQSSLDVTLAMTTRCEEKSHNNAIPAIVVIQGLSLTPAEKAQMNGKGNDSSTAKRIPVSQSATAVFKSSTSDFIVQLSPEEHAMLQNVAEALDSISIRTLSPNEKLLAETLIASASKLLSTGNLEEVESNLGRLQKALPAMLKPQVERIRKLLNEFKQLRVRRDKSITPADLIVTISELLNTGNSKEAKKRVAELQKALPVILKPQIDQIRKLLNEFNKSQVILANPEEVLAVSISQLLNTDNSAEAQGALHTILKEQIIQITKLLNDFNSLRSREEEIIPIANPAESLVVSIWRLLKEDNLVEAKNRLADLEKALPETLKSQINQITWLIREIKQLRAREKLNFLKIDLSKFPLSETNRDEYVNFWGRFSTEQIESFKEFFLGNTSWDATNNSQLRRLLNSLLESPIEEAQFTPGVIIHLFGNHSMGESIVNVNRREVVDQLEVILQQRKDKTKKATDLATPPAKDSTASAEPAKTKKKKTRVIIPTIDPSLPRAAFFQRNLTLLPRAVGLTELSLSENFINEARQQLVRFVRSVVSPTSAFRSFAEYESSLFYEQSESMRQRQITFPIFERDGQRFIKLSSIGLGRELNTQEQAGLEAFEEVRKEFKETFLLGTDELSIEEVSPASLNKWIEVEKASLASSAEQKKKLIHFVIAENKKLVEKNESLEFDLAWVPDNILKKGCKGINGGDLEQVRNCDFSSASLDLLNDNQIRALFNALNYNLDFSETFHNARKEFLRLAAQEKSNAAVIEGHRIQINLLSDSLEAYPIHPLVERTIISSGYNDLLEQVHYVIFGTDADENTLLLFSPSTEGLELHIVKPQQLNDFGDIHEGIPVTINQILQLMRDKEGQFSQNDPTKHIKIAEEPPDFAPYETVKPIVRLTKESIRTLKDLIADHEQISNLMHQAKFDEALKLLEKSIKRGKLVDLGKLKPTIYCNSLIQAAIIYCHVGNYEKGLVVSEEVLRINPNSPQAWDSKFICLSSMGRFDELINEIAKGKEVCESLQKEPEPKFYEALYHISKKDFEKAIMTLENCEFKPKDSMGVVKLLTAMAIEEKVKSKIPTKLIQQFHNLRKTSDPKRFNRMIGEALEYLNSASFFEGGLQPGVTILDIPSIPFLRLPRICIEYSSTEKLIMKTFDPELNNYEK